MSSTTATRDDIIRTLGKLDEATIANVLSLRPTRDDLAIVVDRLRSDAAIWNHKLPRNQRSALLCELLAGTWQNDDHFGTD
jgi:hypothetical protein